MLILNYAHHRVETTCHFLQQSNQMQVLNHRLQYEPPAALRFPGPECYFQRITGCNESSRPIIRAKAFAKQGLARGKNMLYKASRLLHVSPGWVWGFASYLMEPVEGWVRNELLRRSDLMPLVLLEDESG